MKTTNFKGFFLLSIFLSLFLLPGCEDKIVVMNVTVHLINNSSLETHLWLGDESIDPSNKLAAGGGSRTKILLENADDHPKERLINVYAGRSGTILTSKAFTIPLYGTANPEITVVYSSSGALSELK